MYLVIKKKTWKNYLNVLYCVYMHVAPNGKRYVGITSLKPEKRWANGEGYRSQTIFYRAIKKYGWENFKHVILEEELSFEQACEREQYYIKKYKTNLNRWQNPSYGYNRDDGGCTKEPGTYHHTKQTIDKIRLSNKPQWKAIDVFDISGSYLYTTPTMTEAAVRTNVNVPNISKICKGVKYSANHYIFKYHNETKNKSIDPNWLSEMNFGQYTYKGKVYVWNNITGAFIKEFNSIDDVCREYNKKRGYILDAIREQRSTRIGYIFTKEKKPPRKLKKFNGKKVAVNAYSLSGDYLKSFSTITEAALYLEKAGCGNKIINKNNIRRALNNFGLTCGQYRWTKGKPVSHIDVPIRPHYKSVAVIQMTVDGDFISGYDSYKHAAEAVNRTWTNIRSCVQGTRNTCGGYVWKQAIIA